MLVVPSSCPSIVHAQCEVSEITLTLHSLTL